jgi:DNA (cytosine-5)-methyltransferase 3A
MGINVLSLFDGMSCGQQALERVGIDVDNYFASEIDKYAIQVTMANYPNTIQLGSVINVNGYKLPKIDLLIGGSPCQSFSFAGKRKGMSTKCETEILTLEHYLELKADGYQFEGQSYLFWEFMRLLKECNPKYFLLENVEMGEKWEKVLSKAIGVNGIHINSALVSAQNRKRIYWTNIGMNPSGLFGDLESIIEQPKDKGILLKDVLENNVIDKYFLSEKMINSFIIKTNYYKSLGGGFEFKPNKGELKGRTLTNPGKNRMDDNYIIHNMMPRSGNPAKGGTGHLTRTDGKTYCLDTGNTNAIEIISGTLRTHNDGVGFRKVVSGKGATIPARSREDGSGQNIVSIAGNIRRLTPIECERLQTVKDNYTNYVSDSQRYKMLGNGWTVDVISHILNYLR